MSRKTLFEQQYGSRAKENVRSQGRVIRHQARDRPVTGNEGMFGVGLDVDVIKLPAVPWTQGRHCSKSGTVR